MSSLRQLENTARERHHRFEKTLGEIRTRTQFPSLFHETLDLLHVRRRGPPLVAAGAVAGAAWIIHKFLGRQKSRPGLTTKSPTLKQETNHEIQPTNRKQR
jgi:hypothetical protein